MNKNNTIIIIVIIVLAVGGLLYFSSMNTQEVATDVQNMQEAQNVTEELAYTQEMDKAQEELDAFVGTKTFTLSDDSTASYTAQKRFLSKEDEVVVGVTDGVTGTVAYNDETNEVMVDATIELTTLSTGTDGRDSDVAKFFNPGQATFTTIFADEGVSATGAFAGEVTGDLTVNGVTQEVTFDVTGTISEDTFEMTGTTTVLMSDFGISPPSLLEVYTVDDEVELNFTVVGTTN